MLSKTKRVFTTSQIAIPNLPDLQCLSIKKLLEVAKKCGTTQLYLPDLEDLQPKKVSKRFIAAIINTVDPAFMKDALKQYEADRMTNKEKKEAKIIEIDPEMLDLLQKF